MGTSTSSKGPLGRNPLVPPWAEEGDSLTISSGDDNENDTEIDNAEVQKLIPNQLIAQPPNNRFQAARTLFGKYAKTGDRDSLKSSLGHYARNSTGKGSGASKRLAGGITAGSGLFGLLSGNTVSSIHGSLNISDVAGLTVDQAVDKIVTHLTPDSSDSDIIRTALNFALSEALQDQEFVDDVTFNADILGEVFMHYITDLVFQQVVFDMGRAWFHAETPLRQIHMENELRELIIVLVDSSLDRVSNGNLSLITQDQIATIQSKVIMDTVSEWEKYE